MASDGATQIDALFTYLIVRRKNVKATSPRKPDLLLGNDKVAVFMFHREEVTIANDAADGVLLETEGDTPAGEPSLASRDVRRIPHLPSLLKGAKVKDACLAEVSPDIPSVLCTRLVVRSGKVSARFPCGNAAPRRIIHTDVTDFLAQEIVIVSRAASGNLTLVCTPFSSDQQVTRIVLQSLGGNNFEMFFAAGPLSNVTELGDFNPCSATNQAHNGHTETADFEFETLWDLCEGFDAGADKPIPSISPLQGPREDCVPGGG
jgi:hypothetical protein